MKWNYKYSQKILPVLFLLVSILYSKEIKYELVGEMYFPPNVIFDQVNFSNNEKYSAKDNIELSYKDDIISFEFAALSFKRKNKCEYAYKLEGLNNNWINLFFLFFTQ